MPFDIHAGKKGSSQHEDVPLVTLASGLQHHTTAALYYRSTA